jgi:hypothetical protein
MKSKCQSKCQSMYHRRNKTDGKFKWIPRKVRPPIARVTSLTQNLFTRGSFRSEA